MCVCIDNLLLDLNLLRHETPGLTSPHNQLELNFCLSVSRIFGLLLPVDKRQRQDCRN